PDLVLLDVVMPKISGLDILVQVRKAPECKNVPIVILTASTSAETKASALHLGATDFLAKPVDPSELIPRVRNMLVVKAHHDHLEAYTEQLEKAVQVRTTELAASRKHVIECLARAAEYRDDSTGKHILRVGRYAGLIAQQLGFSDEQVELIEQSAQLHDVGKIAVPDNILKKDSELDPAETELMRKHCVYGLQIIQPMSERDLDVVRKHPELCDRVLIDSSPVVQIAGRIALSHHERWDGTGYPLGLAGEDIPIEGRITAVADVYDALSSSRPYKPPIPREKCFEFMMAEADKHFDRQILNAFMERSTDIIRIQMEFADVGSDS
ncbi:MAG: HD domain-containing phosphohydrolase, partial [Dehalococcoidia bacterium]